MADNDNKNQGQDNFDHPIKNNNWWMYILGGLCFVGLIIWFFLEWHHKGVEGDVNDKDVPVELVTPAQPQLNETDTLPQVTIDAAPEAPAAE